MINNFSLNHYIPLPWTCYHYSRYTSIVIYHPQLISSEVTMERLQILVNLVEIPE